ncbi:MAG: hypothetical protein ACREET_11490 [Stellaceae bacterium]
MAAAENISEAGTIGHSPRRCNPELAALVPVSRIFRAAGRDGAPIFGVSPRPLFADASIRSRV